MDERALKRKIEAMESQIIPSGEQKLASTVEALLEITGVGSLSHLRKVRVLKASGGKKSLFHALFGRDSIRMGIDLFDSHPELTRIVILTLARLQGTKVNKLTEEEPGKIIHEHRPKGTYAKALPSLRHFPYYGAIDSTPQYVNLVTHYARKFPQILSEKVKRQDGHSVTVLRTLEDALTWVRRKIKTSELSLIEFRHMTEGGIVNQVWKDSWDAYIDESGQFPNYDFGVAPIEVQGYAYSAFKNTEDIFINLSLAAATKKSSERFAKLAGKAESDAAALKVNIISRFWNEKTKFWSSALFRDANGKLVHHNSTLSNPGHLLNTRIFEESDLELDKKKEKLISRLFDEDMLCLAGIRTRSSRSKAYAPGSYHNGSSWPVDTGWIAQGLRRQGYNLLARELEFRILYAINGVGKHVEFFRGDSEKEIKINRQVLSEEGKILEQPPQVSQGWTVTRVYRIRLQLAADFKNKTTYIPKDKFENRIIKKMIKEKRFKSGKWVKI